MTFVQNIDLISWGDSIIIELQNQIWKSQRQFLIWPLQAAPKFSHTPIWTK